MSVAMRARLIALALVSVVGCTANVASLDSKAGDGLASTDTGTTGGGEGETANSYARVCASAGMIKGIDVSYYETSINWTAAKAGGIQFAFIRVSDGTGFHDPKFAPYWAAAKSAGIIRGAYQFFRPNQDPIAQADLLIAALGGSYAPGDLAPTIDVEVTGGLGPSALASKVQQWVSHVKAKLGVDPIIYTGMYFWRDQVGGLATYKTNPLWVAQYASLCPDLPAPWTRWAFWQNSGTGSAPGVSGAVDTNYFNGSLADLQALANGMASTNPPPPPPPPPASTCMSATLDRSVPEGTCVQSAGDAAWYACSAGMWVAHSGSPAGCTDRFAWCSSATLGKSEPPRTCVQSSSDHVWYQCDGKMWASPVSTTTGMGPAGACSSEHAL